MDELDTGIIVGMEHQKELLVTPIYKDEEKRQREQRKEELKLKLKAYQDKLDQVDEEDINAKRILKMRVMEINDEMLELNDEEMTDQKFWGNVFDDGDEDFEYGRDVCKEADYDSQIVLPYKTIPLFVNNDWFSSVEDQRVVQVSGIMRSGILSNAFLKADIKLVEKNEQEGSDSDLSSEEESDEEEKQDKKESNENEPLYEKIAKFFTTLRYECDTEFLVTDEKCMELLQQDNNLYKVRVYLVSAQNLSAQNAVIDLKSKLAGMTALCTANPYPIITIGEKGMKNTILVKSINEREKAKEADLSPEFHQFWELDC